MSSVSRDVDEMKDGTIAKQFIFPWTLCAKCGWEKRAQYMYRYCKIDENGEPQYINGCCECFKSSDEFWTFILARKLGVKE